MAPVAPELDEAGVDLDAIRAFLRLDAEQRLAKVDAQRRFVAEMREALRRAQHSEQPESVSTSSPRD
ncbi:MAG: hypothetical protein HY744_00865 [Deltaproteobacteria bacterium]|nr:hypothetical protein [Deltaproteobacteria bacterium]